MSPRPAKPSDQPLLGSITADPPQDAAVRSTPGEQFSRRIGQDDGGPWSTVRLRRPLSVPSRSDEERDLILTHIHLPVADTSPRCARDMVIAVLRQWGLEEIVYSVRLATSEVVTNAIQHGSDEETGGEIAIAVMRSGDLFHVEVHDASESLPVLMSPHESEESGRGMLLLQEIVDSCGVTRTAAGKAVWFQIKADWPSAAPVGGL